MQHLNKMLHFEKLYHVSMFAIPARKKQRQIYITFPRSVTDRPSTTAPRRGDSPKMQHFIQMLHFWPDQYPKKFFKTEGM